jgi:hypothetical protein
MRAFSCFRIWKSDRDLIGEILGYHLFHFPRSPRYIDARSRTLGEWRPRYGVYRRWLLFASQASKDLYWRISTRQTFQSPFSSGSWTLIAYGTSWSDISLAQVRQLAPSSPTRRPVITPVPPWPPSKDGRLEQTQNGTRSTSHHPPFHIFAFRL